eukprot:Protomagalhaensia_wolfi_Nauph_80__5798@NODE_71_length_3996_cov_613_706090_g53_i2_p1_GENE_NODE_71_length_3996_cov_613_706090_g53_i2NODE_71_length_3996_cov_613_706090_g53_i2_p1_ORF_typecomplete_len414_score63_42S1P1_nuclease/PF02265_16/1_5e30_NODE_71_length_3996_cov_613_706090_g53_i2651306
MRLPLWVALLGLINAWWNEGHHLICRIALELLQDWDRLDVVDMAETVTKLFPEEFPSHQTFASACTWLDDVGSRTRMNGYIPLFSALHFVNLPSQSVAWNLNDADPDKPSEMTPSGFWLKTMTDAELTNYIANTTRVDIIWGMRRLNLAWYPSGGIAANRIYMSEHAINLKAYSHLIGDAHMPLHCCGLWNEGQHCSGGNAFSVDYTGLVGIPSSGLPSNLHYLWDSMCFWGMGTDLTPETIGRRARELMGEFSYPMLQENYTLNLNGNYDPIYRENYQICSGYGATEDWEKEYFIFKDNDNPTTSILNHNRPTQTFTQGYIDWCSDTSKKLITLSGYRLAHQLESWYDGMHQTARDAIYAEAYPNESECPTLSPIVPSVEPELPGGGGDSGVASWTTFTTCAVWVLLYAHYF